MISYHENKPASLKNSRALAPFSVALELVVLYTLATLGSGPGRTLSSPAVSAAGIAPWNELVQDRTRFATVYQVSDTTRAVRISTDPVHYQDQNGQWQNIDTRVTASTEPGYRFQMTQDDYQAYFKGDSSSPYLARYVAKGGQVDFGINPQQPWGTLNDATPTAVGNTVQYDNIYPGIDLRYTLSSREMLEEFVISRPAVATRIGQIEKRFSVQGVAWKSMPDGSIAFFQPGGPALWSVPRPVMYELNHPQNENYGLHYEIVQENGYYDLVKVVDPAGKAWLAGPQRQFPVVVDDTTVLNDHSLAGGEGVIATNLTTYTRPTNVSKLVVGKLPTDGLTYRAFLEWDTSPIPANVSIQSVGIYFHVANGYGTGNLVNVQKLNNPISSYPDDSAHNKQLYDDIASSEVYAVNLNLFQNPSDMVLPLGYASYPYNTIVGDLQAKVATHSAFGIGLVGSNETNAFASILGSGDTTSPDDHPALVVFYRGIDGGATPIIRPLRNGFFDGKYYWVFLRSDYAPTTGQFYFYSADGKTWTQGGQLSASGNQHHGEWYNSGTVFAAFANTIVGAYTDLYFRKGTVSDTPSPTITWGNPIPVLVATRNPTTDGYDFPTVVQDSNGNCWITTRHVTPSTTGIDIVKSTDSTCTAWNPPTVLLAPTTNGGDSGVGAYVVPLTHGKLYVVFKNLNALEGLLYDGTAWSSPQMIDSNAAFGVYSQGMSIVASGDIVHLVYIGGDGSLKYNAWNNGWGTAITLDAGGTFWSPGLSWDTGDNSLYVAYRASSSHDNPDGTVYYKRGSAPYTINNWGPAIRITSSSYSPETIFGAASPGSTSPWSLSTNYSSNGVHFAIFVDGAFGLQFAPLLPTFQLYLPFIAR